MKGKTLSDWEYKYEKTNQKSSTRNVLVDNSYLMRIYRFISNWTLFLLSEAYNFLKRKENK